MRLPRILTTLRVPWRGHGTVLPRPANAPATRPAAARAPSTPVYPPVDQGIEAVGLDELLCSQAELLARIRVAAGGTETEFSRLYLPPIQNYARFVHLLPATSAAHHRGAGGMLRFGLEVAFYALQATGGVIFAGRETTERRLVLEPRWRYATFLAGLCSELYRPLNDLCAVDPAGTEWPAYQQSMLDWLREGARDHYFVRWNAQPVTGFAQRASAALVIPRIAPDACIEYLREGSPKIISTMLGAITGAISHSEHLPLQHIVEDMRQRVLEHDAKAQPDLYGRLTIGTHLEPYVIDAMRKLVSTGMWKTNEKKARLWYGVDGLFLVWKTAAAEISQQLTQDKIPGVPQDKETLCELLIAAGVFVRNLDGDTLWTLHVPNSQSELSATKFANPALLFPEMNLAPEQLPVVLAPTSAPAVAAAVTPQEPGPSPHTTAIRAAAAAPPTASGSAPSSPRPASGEAPAHDAQQLVNQLPEASAAVVRALIEDHNRGETNGKTFQTKEGFAIAYDAIGSYGIDAAKLVGDIERLGWLMTRGAKHRKLADATSPSGQSISVITLHAAVARDIGFVT